MPSLAARALKVYARIAIKSQPKTAKAAVQGIRRALNHPPLITLLPRGVQHDVLREDGLTGDHLRVPAPQRALLYIHGGGYVSGVTRTYLNLCGRLADALQADVILPAYRLAPEHPFPAALDDGVLAYKGLLRRFAPGQIVIMGDSAGGGLTLATLLAAREQGLPMPGCAVVLSPFADLMTSLPSLRRNDASDAMLSARMLSFPPALYVPDPALRSSALASPARAADYTGLPPLLITVSESECLRDDAYAVAAKARAANIPVEFISRPDLMHVWPVFYPLMPEAREDVERIIAFVRQWSAG
ncbi:MAG: alpha/beta hydrolase [Gammaproteobacteria bacterium]|nr:alpha/beta hydrolase [Gammaproteobacteria bacterium]